MKRRHGLLPAKPLALVAAPLLLLAASLTAGAAEEAEETQSVLARARAKGKKIRAFWAAQKERAKDKKLADVRYEKKILAQAAEELQTLSSRGVTTGDVSETAQEPGGPEEVVDRAPIADMYWASADDFDYHEHMIWTLKAEDFRFLGTARVMIEKPLGGRDAYWEADPFTGIERLVFRDVFFAIPFVLTNSTDGPLRIAPRMWLVSENMRFTPEIAGFIAQEDVERSMFRELDSTWDIIGYLKKNPDGSTEPVGTLRAGETRYGVGIFPLPDPEFDELALIVEGLNNTYRFDRRQKRVLAIRFTRRGDEFYPTHEPLKYVGKEWVWIWMWYEDLEVAPIEPFTFETPSGVREEPKALWAYQVTLTNHTDRPQDVRIREFNTVVRMRALEVDVEVELVDNGRSTIHKAWVMEQMAQEFSGDRFDIGTLDPEQAKVFLVIFDKDDINWDSIYTQVEAGLTGDISIGYGVEPLKPGLQSFLVDPTKLARVRPVVLTDEKKAQIRQEINSAVEDAIAAEQQRRTLKANVTAAAGLASGTYRIVRSFFRKGTIDSHWIKRWEEY